MRAGSLRHRITLQRPERTRSPRGSEETTWIDVATVWAGIEPLTPRERLAGQQDAADITVKIRLRYRADVAASWRAVSGGIVYGIEGPPIDFNHRHRELVLMCKVVEE